MILSLFHSPDRLYKLLLSVFSLVTLYFCIPISKLSAYYTNMPASVVVGQSDFISYDWGVTSQSLYQPEALWSDGNRLVIPDEYNNRVLIFNSIPNINYASADVVIGQEDFISNSENQGGTPDANTLNRPRGVCSDGTKLIIVDSHNSRLLIFNSFPTRNNASADVVIGQKDFISNSANQGGTRGANTLNLPRSRCHVNMDGKLFVSDYNSSRILIFNSIPTRNNASADVVVGQKDFSSGSANQGGARAANTLYRPMGVFSDNKRLYIADTFNNRLLIFNSIPTQNNASADVVVGQKDFSSGSANQGGEIGANTLWYLRTGFSDGQRLYIDDRYNARVLIFNSIPTVNNTPADMVLGKQDFNSDECQWTQSGMCAPLAPFATENKLFIPDNGLNRVLIFDNVLSTPGISISTAVSISDSRKKISGTVVLGEREKYTMQRIQADVNGGGFGDVTYKDGGRDQGEGDTIYEWYHEFEPWANLKPKDQWDEKDGYSFKVKAFSFNAEENYAFYFSELKLESIDTDFSFPSLTFSVPRNHLQRIKDNISRFEIWIDEKKYLTDISPDLINTESGKLTVLPSTLGVTTEAINLSAGTYEVKVKAIDNWGHSFESNSLSFNTVNGIYFKGGSTISSIWFPLQINKISGANTGIISSFNPISIKSSYSVVTLNPTISGIAFADSIVNLRVVNNRDLNQTSVFLTTVGQDSNWKLTPNLFYDSTLYFSVSKDSFFSSILPFSLKLSGNN